MPRAAPKPTHAYTPTTDGGMDEYNSFDVPSPSNSLYYNMYADADQYLESHTSESQSPSGSLVGFGEVEHPRGISDSLSVRCPVWRVQWHHTRLPKSRARRGRLARVAGTDQAGGQEKAGEPLQERPSLRFVG